jgi:dihydropteroate synthase
MGILNLSGGSFSEIGKALTVADAVAQAKAMVNAGAVIIDIGAEPTNPVDSTVVSEAEELQRLIPVIQAIATEVDTIISVDTSRPAVMQAAIAAGAHMINDVRALREPGAVAMAVQLNVPVCLMHMWHYRAPDAAHRSEEETSQPVMQAITTFLQERIATCLAAGMQRDKIVIDPGIGTGCFGKSTQENIHVLQHMHQLHELGLPILAGASRKTFIGAIDNDAPAIARLGGSIAAALVLAEQGIHIIRVHDVAETAQAMKLMQKVKEQNIDR